MTVAVVMGVSGSGKTTVADGVARRNGWRLVEGDKLHPPANVAKMKSGTPLTDADRWPWLRAIAHEIDAIRARGESAVVASSALKRAYRDILIGDRPDVALVYLQGSKDLIARRMAARENHFAAQGAKVAFVDIADDAAHELTGVLEAAGHAAAFYQHCDLKDVGVLQAAIAEVGKRLGPITVLVNNAANDQRHRFEDVTVQYWDERLATNLRHQFFAIQAVAPMMRAAGGGSIVNFGSVSWHTAQGGMPAYTTAKAGVEGLTRGMARDLGPAKVRVNTVIPGWIMTKRQIELWLTPEVEENLIRSQCLKEKLAPSDVTRLVLWLASDDSQMCTAQLWVVDGGRM